MNTNEVLNKLIAEIEEKINLLYKGWESGKILHSSVTEGRLTALREMLNLITSLQQEQPDTCIFGNTPSEEACKFCGVNCELREPKQSGITSTNLSSTNEAVGLAIMAYLDTKVKHDNAKVCGVSLKVAREWIREKIANKQEQPEVNIWHDVKKEAPTNFGAEIIVLCKNKNKEDGIWLADLIQCFEGQYEPRVNWEDPVKWAYLSEILPQRD